MTNLATILFAMQKDMMANAFKRRGTDNKPKKFNFQKYREKMEKYEEVFDSIINTFMEENFGPYANKIDSITFVNALTVSGWKYFDLNQLNELFALKYEEMIQQGLFEDLAEIEENTEDEDSFFSLKPTVIFEDNQPATKSTLADQYLTQTDLH